MHSDVLQLTIELCRRRSLTPDDAGCQALIAEEAGVHITDGRGQPLDAILNTTEDISWIGYANEAIRAQIEPRLQAALRARKMIP